MGLMARLAGTQTMSEFLLFIAGVHLTMQLIASLYRILDLWYRIEDFLLPVTRSILFYALTMALIWWFLEGSNRSAFVWGCLFFISFHVSVFWLARAVFKVVEWRKKSLNMKLPFIR